MWKSLISVVGKDLMAQIFLLQFVCMCVCHHEELFIPLSKGATLC